jgi:hypothetical protein
VTAVDTDERLRRAHRFFHRRIDASGNQNSQ